MSPDSKQETTNIMFYKVHEITTKEVKHEFVYSLRTTVHYV